ncbi:MAG: alpha/beta fold hydrolase [Burkholderiales bacterium]
MSEGVVTVEGGLRIEVARVGVDDPAAPLVVFLHEGLGSVALWKDTPARLCAAGGWRGLVYSRPGYGHSTPRAAHERWGTDFMHRQALEVLPAVLAACGIDAAREPPWLFGHSDGGTIALIHAASLPERVAGAIVLAPHVFVEDCSIDSIVRAREAYAGGLRERLARFHDDVDSAFFGWADAWLAPAFRDWSIVPLLGAIRCPVLAIQGHGDEYGTMAQIDAIERAVPGARSLRLKGCGHSPHRDRPDAVLEAARAFVHQPLL